jgi:NAD(P)-dependent dehydrogenase (short-subunit alcohol dehydrogenase family)
MKNILITGSSTGIGKACAIAAAEAGYLVYAGFRKDSDGEALASLHSNIKPLKIDVCKEEDRLSAVKFIESEHGHLDCLFNNAGISAAGPSEFQSLDTFKQQMEVNFIAPVALTKAFIPLLRKSDDPRILFTGSASGILAKPMMASYAASKFAIEAFVDTIRVELAPWNIKVSIFEPGKIKTEIYKKSLEDALKAEQTRSEEESRLYGDLIKVAMYNIKNADSMSSEVSEVVDVFMHALTSSRPKTRYPVGGDAKTQAIVAKYFPDKLKDWFMKRRIKKLMRMS